MQDFSFNVDIDKNQDRNATVPPNHTLGNVTYRYECNTAEEVSKV